MNHAIGYVCLAFAVLTAAFFPLSSHIEYKVMVKKYGKEVADEHFRRMW